MGTWDLHWQSYLKLQMEVFSFPLLVEFLHEVAAGYLYNNCIHVYACSSR